MNFLYGIRCISEKCFEKIFLYPQGDRSDMRKPKKDKHQH